MDPEGEVEGLDGGAGSKGGVVGVIDRSRGRIYNGA